MEDKQFLEDLRAQKQCAYSRLLEEYQGKVFNTCLSFVPNKEDAEDIAQEVFVEVYNSVGKFKGNAKLSTWIYRISVNKSLEFIRKKSAKKRFGFMQSITGGGLPMDKSTYFTEFNHPGIQLENKEKSELLFNAIAKLPEAQKVVFTLHKVDGMSYKEVGEVTQKSISSIESLLFRAKKNLQKILTEYYKNEP
ncbi:RNA polymerase sigma factor [Flagellimonas sp. CMM7]|uniref:RNA polymerase sigma factor n=1 Tax=Flagellimonas sp. CMM7 TaxID=2654676 RepID=UPI0013D21A85|nr:sigma-70 family RNA polymerase sigma factor [Flagellimonas sp. CMM7]UII80669.1 sigma-70 family RNA polymerase sigma factor [Flagellimonas sp. CMM7]